MAAHSADGRGGSGARIGIDAHALGTRAGGNETFIRQLLLGLAEIAPDTDIVAYVHREVHENAYPACGFPTYPLAARSSWLRVPFALPAAARATGARLLHVQYIAPPRCPCPFVVTLHDMVWKRFPETLRAVDRLRLAALVPGTLRRAARVFVVSEAMKREAAELYGVPDDRMDVVYNSVDPLYQPVGDGFDAEAFRLRLGLPRHYIAYIGAVQPRKNIARLAEAVSRLRDRGLPHALVVAGKPAWLYGPLRRRLEELRLGDRLVFTGYLERDDLPRLLHAADAFAYVSLYEGFGLPVVEAMACGTPTLASAIPAHAETTAGAALLCDPASVDAIEEGLARILTDAELRADLTREGPERARRFNHASMARAALEGYRRATA